MSKDIISQQNKDKIGIRNLYFYRNRIKKPAASRSRLFL